MAEQAIEEGIVMINIPLSEVSKRDQEIARLKSELKTATDKIRWFHTQIKLRCTIEVAEIKYRPITISDEDYASKSRREKWDLIISNGIFPEFHSCVSSIENANISNLINDMYGVLNARIHRYLCTDEMDNSNFKDDKLNQLSKCIDILSGRLM